MPTPSAQLANVFFSPCSAAMAHASAALLSDRLGFSEPSAFRRAFRRWTGSPPGSYRRDAAV